jgi:hypothetical protein
MLFEILNQQFLLTDAELYVMVTIYMLASVLNKI